MSAQYTQTSNGHIPNVLTFDIERHPGLDLIAVCKFLHHHIVICCIITCYVPDLETGE
jgi:hypothetical protein